MSKKKITSDEGQKQEGMKVEILDKKQIFKEGVVTTVVKKMLAKKPLERIWHEHDHKAFRFFCSHGIYLDLHFSTDKSETIDWYLIQCNGENCILCKKGHKFSRYFHIPVYRVETNDIAMLAISPSMEQTIRPLILNLLSNGERPGAFISEDDDDCTVVPFTIPPGMNLGDSVMDDFLASYPEGDFNCFRLYYYDSNGAIVGYMPNIEDLLGENGLYE